MKQIVWVFKIIEFLRSWGNIRESDVISGQSLVGSNAWCPPVFQALSPYQFSSQYLKWFSSSGSDTIRKMSFRQNVAHLWWLKNFLMLK
jgi:hypothetical protein